MAALALNPETLVGAVVATYPVTRRMMEALGIDYCCGGNRMLAEAAAEANVPVETVIAVLNTAIAQAAAAPPLERDWQQAPLDDLMAHIVITHHTLLRRELPRLRDMLQKVQHAHGAMHGDILQPLAETFTGLATELEAHLHKEEDTTFPAISRLEQGICDKSTLHMVTELEDEHEHAGTALATMRKLTNQYALPRDACLTYSGLYEGLQELEQDLHQHVHLENNILFPRVRQLIASCERAA